MKFALHNYNEVFLKFALRNLLFGPAMLSSEEMINELLGILTTGTKTELVLNCLSFTNYSLWPQRLIRQLVNLFKEINNKQHDQNRILLCYNTILVICLISEQLVKIGKAINAFKHEGLIVIKKLLQLGAKIIENTDDDKIKPMLLDTDFKDRTVINLITSNGFQPLFMD